MQFNVHRPFGCRSPMIGVLFEAAMITLCLVNNTQCPLSQKGPSDIRSLCNLGNIRADLAACGASGGKGMSPMLVFRMVGPSGILASLGLGSVRMFNSGASALHALLLVPLSMMAQCSGWCINGEFGWRRLL